MELGVAVDIRDAVPDCLEKGCVDCDFHVMRGEKLNCNFGDRLNLGKKEITDFIRQDSEEEEKVDYA